MSYDIIKSIKIRDNKVFINHAANNVCPHYYAEHEADTLTEILQKQGRDALELEIFKAYESGCFQRGSNKYVRALAVLRHMIEYRNFDWRLNGAEYEAAQTNRKDEVAFDALLRKALKTRLPKDRYIISKGYNGSTVYLRRITTRCAKFCQERIGAKIFRYEIDARNLKHCFHNSENWNVEKLN